MQNSLTEKKMFNGITLQKGIHNQNLSILENGMEEYSWVFTQ